MSGNGGLRGYSTRTSGDLVADRRFAYAEAAMAEQDLLTARDLYSQTLELVPGWPPAHFALAKACLAAGDTGAADAALRRVRALDPDDRLGAGVLLARLAGATGREAMPDAYVAGLFDEYAPRFDSHLTGALNYRAPALIRAMLDRHAAPAWSAPAGIDLGCGTGLMARALEGRCGALAGVDLSAGMLKVAAETGLYARLECRELLAFLRDEPAAIYDLVIAADVFCYVPDLAPVFAQTARVLVPGGLFAFSIQTPDHGDNAAAAVAIGADARVHHAEAHVRDMARAAGFLVREAAAVSTREDRGIPVPGALFLLAKP